MVNANLGISCLSVAALKEGLQAKTLAILLLENVVIERDFFQIKHKEKYHSSLVEIFEACLVSYSK